MHSSPTCLDDLPALAGTAADVPQNTRAELLARDLERQQTENTHLRAALEQSLDELRWAHQIIRNGGAQMSRKRLLAWRSANDRDGIGGASGLRVPERQVAIWIAADTARHGQGCTASRDAQQQVRELRGARADCADKSWLAAELAAGDIDARRRQESLAVAVLFAIAAAAGAIAFDWAQGQEWANAVVRVLYGSGAQ